MIKTQNKEISKHVNIILNQVKILKLEIKLMQILNYKLMIQIFNITMKT